MHSALSSRVLPPALPEKAKLPRRTLSLGVQLFAACLILLTASSISPAFQKLFQPLVLNSFARVLELVAAAFLALALHEAGHLLAAICCRFEIFNVSLGLFRFSRTASGWRLRGRARRVFTGSVSAMPPTNESWRERMLIVVAAGPAATLLSALLAACATRVIRGEVACFFSMLFQISFLIFALGLVPTSSQAGDQNDASLFRVLCRNGKDADGLFLYHLVLQHQNAGLEPAAFPLWLVELMATYMGRLDFMVLYAGMLASWSFDRGDHRTGDLWDQRAIKLSSEANAATRAACLANSACFDLVFRNNQAAAKNKLSQINWGSLFSPSLLHRARATRELALGRIALGLEEVSAARQDLPARLRDGGFEWFLLKRLHVLALSTH